MGIIVIAGHRADRITINFEGTDHWHFSLNNNRVTQSGSSVPCISMDSLSGVDRWNKVEQIGASRSKSNKIKYRSMVAWAMEAHGYLSKLFLHQVLLEAAGPSQEVTNVGRGCHFACSIKQRSSSCSPHVYDKSSDM